VRFTLTRTSAIRSTRNLIAFTCALAAAALAATAFPDPGQAATPRTVAEAQARVNQLNDQAEQLTEQYNAAKARLAKATTLADAAKKRASQAANQLSVARAQVAAFAVERYEAGGASQALSSVIDGDPQVVADRIATLSILGQTQSAAVTRAHAAQLTYRQQLAAADQATSAAEAIQAQLAQQKQRINALLARANQVLNQLTAEQRAKLLAAQRAQAAAAQARAAAATRANRSIVRDYAPPAGPQSAGGSAVAQRAVAAAMSKLGKPYVWGAAGPNAFDCSGLVQWAYRQAGVSTAHYTGTFWSSYRHVSYNQLQPGDLVFFYPDHHHVGIYIGGGMMVDAPQTGDVVKVQSVMGHGRYSGAVRVVG
jgi:cell wall-associated NlpC family hydrolase